MNPPPPDPQKPDAQDQAKAAAQAELVRKIEILISTLLRTGVICSLLVVALGLVLCFVHHPAYLHSATLLKQVTSLNHPAWSKVSELVHGVAQARGEAVIMAGLLLLIATPVLRVAVSIFGFSFERDWIFVVVTSFVLAMLILSFLLGKVEG